MAIDPTFQVFEPWEFEPGPDIPWIIEQSERSKWSPGATQFLWCSAWKMLLPLMRRKGVSEIIVKGPKAVWVQSSTGMILTSLNFDPDLPVPTGWPCGARRPDESDLLAGLNRIHTCVEQRPLWSPGNPLGDVAVEANLEDGSRLQGWCPPLTVDSTTTFNIRRFSSVKLGRDDFIACRSLTAEAWDVLRMAIQAHCPFLVVAGTGAGKTTLLEAMAGEIPEWEIPITIEDTPELKIVHPLYRGFRTRPMIASGGDFRDESMKSLLKRALRALPDWIIVGEIRDSPDPSLSAADAFMEAIASGHYGAATLHAHDDFGALTRMESMLRSARPTSREESLRLAIGESIRLVVVMERINERMVLPDGSFTLRPRRRVERITEVLGSDGHTYHLNPLFKTRNALVQVDLLGGKTIQVPERQLTMVGIPFFGLELKDQGMQMPDWWHEAHFTHVGRLRAVGRAAHMHELLELDLNGSSVAPLQITQLA